MRIEKTKLVEEVPAAPCEPARARTGADGTNSLALGPTYKGYMMPFVNDKHLWHGWAVVSGNRGDPREAVPCACLCLSTSWEQTANENAKDDQKTQRGCTQTVDAQTRHVDQRFRSLSCCSLPKISYHWVAAPGRVLGEVVGKPGWTFCSTGWSSATENVIIKQ